MRVLVTGAGGQVGGELLRRVPADVTALGVSHADLDIADPLAVAALLHEFAPDVIINCAAYTAVDRAEQEPDLAWRVNAEGPRTLAAALAPGGERLVHISTDYVFDGTGERPWRPEDRPAPLGVYGSSKLGGEIAVQELLGTRAAIVRTAWVYASHGRNFLTTMLRVMAERGAVRVVADQTGTPTAAVSLAEALWRCAQRDVHGVLHWTDAGVATWYEFAVAIAAEAQARGLLGPVAVTPISTAQYPTPAARPAYSVLDKAGSAAQLGLEPQPWRQRLCETLDGMRHG